MPRRIWALADTHLSHAKPKPMHIFGEHWRDHPRRIMENCHAVMDDTDILLMPGDLSWALKRADAELDLAWIARLPGTKVLCKGNHDYWWDSDTSLNYPGLQDTPWTSEDGKIGVAGTRGWFAPTSEMTDQERIQCEKISSREVLRLEKRLTAVKNCAQKYAMTHYPPLAAFAPLLKAHGVNTVLYGHLHINGNDIPLPEEWQGMRAVCVAADRLHFMPRLIATVV